MTAAITRNTGRDNRTNGVHVATSVMATVTDNRIENNGRAGIAGVLIDRVSHAEISRNVLMGNRGEGGLVMNRTVAAVQHNEICANAQHGVWVRDSSSVTLTENTVCGNAGDGIQIGQALISDESSAAAMRGGTMTQNTGNGVFVVNRAMASIGLEGAVVMITHNEGAGLFVSSDALAVIDRTRIIFQDNRGGDIIGPVIDLTP